MESKILALILARSSKSNPENPEMFRVVLPDGPCNMDELSATFSTQGYELIEVGTTDQLDKIEKDYRTVTKVQKA